MYSEDNITEHADRRVRVDAPCCEKNLGRVVIERIGRGGWASQKKEKMGSRIDQSHNNAREGLELKVSRNGKSRKRTRSAPTLSTPLSTSITPISRLTAHKRPFAYLTLYSSILDRTILEGISLLTHSIQNNRGNIDIDEIRNKTEDVGGLIVQPTFGRWEERMIVGGARRRGEKTGSCVTGKAAAVLSTKSLASQAEAKLNWLRSNKLTIQSNISTQDRHRLKILHSLEAQLAKLRTMDQDQHKLYSLIKSKQSSIDNMGSVIHKERIARENRALGREEKLVFDRLTRVEEIGSGKEKSPESTAVRKNSKERVVGKSQGEGNQSTKQKYRGPSSAQSNLFPVYSLSLVDSKDLLNNHILL